MTAIGLYYRQHGHWTLTGFKEKQGYAQKRLNFYDIFNLYLTDFSKFFWSAIKDFQAFSNRTNRESTSEDVKIIRTLFPCYLPESPLKRKEDFMMGGFLVMSIW